MHAEPQPASLPLPGGSDGATVRLHPLLVARTQGPDAYLHRETGRLAGLHSIGVGVGDDRKVEIPYVAFLVEHPTAGRLLIDTAFHASVAVDPKQNLGRFMAQVMKPRMEPGEAIPAQLRARGIEPSEIRTVLMTHLHADHASGIAEFPGATFLVSHAEWRAATETPRPLLHGYVRRNFDHAFDFRTIDFDAAGIDSHATFGRGVDVFGDGSVVCVSTPGHTLGHMSVVLRLGAREALIAGDAIYTRRTLDEGVLPYRVEDEHLFRRSLREIQIYAEQTPDALIVPGHDSKAWGELDAVYE
jgi:N-acyl homoserine lactone hydrolase